MESKYFENLDVCRTLLALLVAVGHFFLWNGVQNRVPGSFFLAVDFFFVLSGFVLAQTVFSSTSQSMSEFVTHFITRRVFRLFPLYLVLFSVAALVQLVEFRGESDPFYYFLFSALMLQSMGFDAGATHIFADTTIGIAWSISCEFWVGIIVFPVVYYLRDRKELLAIISIGLACVSLALIVQYSPEYYLNANFQRVSGVLTVATLRCFIGFMLGIVAFLIYKKIEPMRFQSSISLIESLAILICILLYAHFTYDKRNEFVAPFLFVIIIVTFALQKGVISKVLSIKQLKPIQHLSYAIYLVHPLFVYAYRKMSMPFDVTHSILYIALILISAEILHRFVEKPGIKIGRSIFKTNIRDTDGSYSDVTFKAPSVSLE